MGFKGTSFIELTDVHTGEKQVYEDNNLVTMAVPKALTFHFGNTEMAYTMLSTYTSNLLPVVPKAVGGILCFENPLVEDAAVLYAEPSNKVVGCSGNSSHSTASAIRGSMNAAESGPLDDGTGYRFVFDFATSQGNGTISALALTSANGGISAFGDTINPLTWNLSSATGGDSLDVTSNNFSNYKRLVAVLSYMVSIRPEKGDAVALIPLATGDIEIVSVAFPTAKVDLSGGYWKEPKSYRTLATITPSKAFFNGNDTGTQTSYFYGTFLDGGDGYWWGFSNRGSSSPTTTNIYWLKINQETFEVEEGKWTLNNLSLADYTSIAYSDTLDARYWYDYRYVLKNFCHSIIGGGYLYLIRYDRTQVYKINLSQPTDITAIDISTVAEMVNGYSRYPRQYMMYVHGRVYLPTGWIDSDNTFNEATISWPDVGFMPAVYKKDQVYAFSFSRQGSSSTTQTYRIRPHLITPYLATINNLSKPVQKTADKTMKITYILREE